MDAKIFPMSQAKFNVIQSKEHQEEHSEPCYDYLCLCLHTVQFAVQCDLAGGS